MATSSIFDNIVIHNPKAIEAYIHAMEQREKGTFPEIEIPAGIRMADDGELEKIHQQILKRRKTNEC